MQYQKENFNGIYDFRCRFHNGFIVESHIHEYSEILYCQSGDCEICVNGKKIRLQAHEFIFIPPHYIHQYNVIDADVICAVFSNDFIPLFFKSTKGRKTIVANLEAKELRSIFEKLPYLDKNNGILITAYLNLICNQVLEQSKWEEFSAMDGLLYQKVISYIAEYFQKDISLKQIAKELGYNEKYLSSTIHLLTGMHFSNFLAMYRIEYAKELLAKSSELSITEIALHCGFAAVNTFNRQFKKLTSMTPMQYKKVYSITKK